MVAGLYAQGDQGPGKGIHVVPEFAVGAGIIQRSITEGLLIRKFLHDTVQHLGKGELDQLVFLPGEVPGLPAVGIKQPRPDAVHLPVHIVGKMRKNDILVVQVRVLRGGPYQRKEPVVVQGTQRVHDLFHGDIALAHQTVVGRFVFARHRITHVDMLDISA